MEFGGDFVAESAGIWMLKLSVWLVVEIKWVAGGRN